MKIKEVEKLSFVLYQWGYRGRMMKKRKKNKKKYEKTIFTLFQCISLEEHRKDNGKQIKKRTKDYIITLKIIENTKINKLTN